MRRARRWKRCAKAIGAFLRRSGRPKHEAEDITQDFFASLVFNKTLKNVRREKGRLRSFLLGALKRDLRDRLRGNGARKRGGGAPHVSLEAMVGTEERYASELSDTRDPEWLFNHAWAQDLLSGVVEELRAAHNAADAKGDFDLLLPFIAFGEAPPPHAELAVKLGASRANTRLKIHRLRLKFRDLLQAEVARTVLAPEEIPAELAWLRAMLAEN